MRLQTLKHMLLSCLILLSSGLSGCVVAAQLGLASMQEGPYDRQGVQKGEKLADFRVYNLNGKPTRLSTAWKKQPALIVHGSYTCPVARLTLPRLPQLEARYGNRLRIIVLYVYEPHPKGDPSPYTGKEWVTFSNIFSGILHRQPRSLGERLELANKFDAHIEGRSEIWVDNMDNSAWNTISGGPNTALFVDEQGTVLLKQGWFELRSMRNAIDDYFGLPHLGPDENRLRTFRGPRQ